MTKAQEEEQVFASKIASSTVLLFVRRGVITAASGAAGIVIARWLTPTGYGQFQSALVTWTLLLSFTDFGFSLALSRDFAADPDRTGRRLRSAYRVQGVTSLVMTAVIVGIAFSVGLDTNRGLSLLVLAPSVLFGAFAAGRVYYQAIFDVIITVRIDIITNLIQIAAMVLLAVGGFGPVGVAAAVSLGTMAASGWIGAAALRATTPEGPALGVSEIVRPALPLGVIAIMSKMYISADIIILGFLVSGANVGQYAAAAKILTLLNTLPGLLMASALPGFAAAMKSPEQLAALTRRVLQWSTAVMVPVFLFAVIFAHGMTEILLGREFAPAAPLIRILCVAGVVGVYGQIIGALLVAHRTVHIMVWQNAIAAALNIGLNLLLVPVYGVVAAAWITTATECFVVGASLVTMLRRLEVRLPVGRFLVRPLATLVPALLAMLIWGDRPLVLVCSAFSLPFMYLLCSAWPDDLVPPRWRGTRWTWTVPQK